MTKFLLGLGIGVGVGLLIAPAPGEETRRQLRERAEEYKEQKLGQVIEMGREKAGSIGQEAGEKAFDEAAKKVVGPDVVERSRRA